MQFDFSGFRTNPPAGMTVRQADKSCLRLWHVARHREYKVSKTPTGQFLLETWTANTGLRSEVVTHPEINFVLRAVGYVKKHIKEVDTKPEEPIF